MKFLPHFPQRAQCSWIFQHENGEDVPDEMESASHDDLLENLSGELQNPDHVEDSAQEVREQVFGQLELLHVAANTAEEASGQNTPPAESEAPSPSTKAEGKPVVSEAQQAQEKIEAMIEAGDFGLVFQEASRMYGPQNPPTREEVKGMQQALIAYARNHIDFPEGIMDDKMYPDNPDDPTTTSLFVYHPEMAQMWEIQFDKEGNVAKVPVREDAFAISSFMDYFGDGGNQADEPLAA